MGKCDKPIGISHPPPRRRRRVVADPNRRHQHRLGPTSQRPAGGLAGARNVFCPLVVVAGRYAQSPAVAAQADAWRQVAATPAALPAVQADDTYATAGQLTASLDVDTTRLLLGEVPAAFHAGVQDILLIAFGLAFTEFLGEAAPIGIDIDDGRHEEVASRVDLSRTVGWFTTKYPAALKINGTLDWSQVVAGESALGAVIKDAKEQLRAQPDGLTYGLLRYLNTEVDLDGPDPVIGFNYLGRLAAGADLSDELMARQRRQPVVGRGGHGGGNALGAHRGTQRRHHGHRGRAEPARQLALGAVGADRRASKPVEQVVVRGPHRYLRACAQRWWGVDAVRYRPRPPGSATDRRTLPATPDRRRAAAQPRPAGTALPHQLRTGTRRPLRGAARHHRERFP